MLASESTRHIGGAQMYMQAKLYIYSNKEKNIYIV